MGRSMNRIKEVIADAAFGVLSQHDDHTIQQADWKELCQEIGRRAASSLEHSETVLVVRMPVLGEPEFVGSPTVTISGPRAAVLRTVALASGLKDEFAVEVRPCAVDEDQLLVVDARQAESYQQFLAEVVR